MECFGDFCLVCDKQINGTPFCSQACRLAELDHSISSSMPSSPAHSRLAATPHPRLRPVTATFELPPAIDFMAYRRSRHLQSRSVQQPGGAQSLKTKVTVPVEGPRHTSLTPSSSQTSLSSLRTNTTSPGGISEQAWTELRSYASSFDQTRTLRRRLSTL